ncbi:hypothetical protein [Micromonospora tulbaghiae]|uniref:hypothetical protein n=1 Tax=Micromonospora tulbaghiae TaxID=479978 RepID=UPI0033E3E1A2
MNVLGQVIPGLREARTPFAVGLIWSLAGWVACSLLPSTVWQKPIFITAASQIAKIPQEVSISVLIFAIYVAGILLEAVGRMIKGIAIGLFYMAAFLTVMSFASATVPQLLFVAVLLLALLFIYAFARQRRLGGASYRDVIEDTILSGGLSLAGRIEAWIRIIRHSFEADKEVFDALVVEELELYFQRNDSYLNGVLGGLDDDQLFQAAFGVGLTLEEVYAVSETSDRDELRGFKVLSDVRLARRHSDIGFSDVRLALELRLKRSVDDRAKFASVALEFDELRKILRRRLLRAELQLRVDNADLFGEYDRIKAEGELRAAIAVPVAVLLALVAYKWHLTFNADSSLTPLWFLFFGCAVTGVTLTMAGRGQTIKSNRILYSSVRTGLISVRQDEEIRADALTRRAAPKLQKSSVTKFVVQQHSRHLRQRLAKRLSPRVFAADAQGESVASIAAVPTATSSLPSRRKEGERG